MAKVSIGLRGWRFDEAEVFTAEGALRPPEAMDEDVRRRLLRLPDLVGRPCHACWLEHGDAEACETASVVYGEPLAEVLLCADHERDFYYWFETGGEVHAGDEAFADAFHEWFADGNRAPADYEGVDHVETDPEDVPEPDVKEGTPVFDVATPDGEAASVDLRQYDDGADAESESESESESADPAAGLEVDFDADYPTGDE